MHDTLDLMQDLLLTTLETNIKWFCVARRCTMHEIPSLKANSVDIELSTDNSHTQIVAWTSIKSNNGNHNSFTQFATAHPRVPNHIMQHDACDHR